MEECDGSDLQVWFWKRLVNGNNADRAKEEKQPLVKQEMAGVAF